MTFHFVCFVLWCYPVVLITTRVSPPQTALVSFISRRATHCLFVFLFVVVHTFLVVFAVIELRNFVLILKSSDPSVNTLYLGIKAEVNSSV